ncbi:hypothetical protein GCM10009105_10170 [Dokdonella soli]|uniref:Uncharacterized protein n=2 Tax=Dokdonella soli TaxID=529810 RepID=A0ABN1IDW9_9GAMM
MVTITFPDENNRPAAGAALAATFDASRPVLTGYYHNADPKSDDFAMVRLQSDLIFADSFDP